jgi:hypothetical protein
MLILATDGEYPLCLISRRKGSRYTRVQAPPPQPEERSAMRSKRALPIATGR